MRRTTNHRRFELPPPEVIKTFEALDDLPVDLRREVCFAARVWDAPMVLNLFRQNKRGRGETETVRWLIASIQAGDEQDLRDFAFQHQLKYKQPLPHYAAEATILRFQPPVQLRHARSRRAVPLHVRAAWRSSERLMPHDGVDESPAYQDPTDPALESRFGGLDFLPEATNAA